MLPGRSFQGLILTLSAYWAAKGCIILQPYDLEVGAGTFHPATTLRALGPRPWNAAYVQPSRRPKDGRYGENPNRLQHYYQYQVILKPNPPDLQELYLGSLQAIGIDTLVHDIRFHREIVAMSGNAYLASLIEHLSSQTVRARIWRGLTEGGAAERTLSEHRAIADAIAQHDPALATSLATAHIAGVERWLRQAATA